MKPKQKVPVPNALAINKSVTPAATNGGAPKAANKGTTSNRTAKQPQKKKRPKAPAQRKRKPTAGAHSPQDKNAFKTGYGT